MTIKVFLSYSSIDKHFVEKLATDLNTEKIDVWLDNWEILLGDSIPAKIQEGLNSANVFLLVLSPNSVDSSWVIREKDSWLDAQIRDEEVAKQESRPPNRRLIPILHQHCQKPFFLGQIRHVEINYQNYQKGFQELVRGIRRENSKPPSVPVEALPGIAPRIQAFNLLKSILPTQFDEVIFRYEVDKAQLPMNVTQVEKANVVLKLAVVQCQIN